MFRLDEYLEHWAEIYRPLSHDPSPRSKHRSFYRIDRLGDSNEFVRNFNTAPSPCMSVPTNINAGMGTDINQVVYHHALYFMVKQPTLGLTKTALQDDLTAAQCKEELDSLAQALLAYLKKEKTQAKNYPNNYEKELRIALSGIDIQSAEWWSVPKLYNGWWVLGLEFDRIDSRKLCVNPADYLTDLADSSSSE